MHMREGEGGRERIGGGIKRPARKAYI